MGRTSVTMYISLGMNLINLVGDYIGVHVLQAGVAGVAVPTLLSRAFAAVVMPVLAFRPGKAVRLRWSHIFAWDAGEIRRLLHIAVPGGVENGLFALGKVLMVSIVSHFGTVQIAANGVAGSIDQIAVMVVNAVNLAIVPVVGRCVGAGEEEQAQAYTKKLMGISYWSLAVLGLGSALLLGVALGLGILGVWIAMGLDWLARSVAFGIRYKSGKWKEMCVI